MKLKHGVSIVGSIPEIITARKVAEILWGDHNQELVVTSGTEKPELHKESSLHAEGKADDYRVRYFDEATQIIIRGQLIMRLGYISKHYQVILHINHHMHIEYDERKKL